MVADGKTERRLSPRYPAVKAGSGVVVRASGGCPNPRQPTPRPAQCPLPELSKPTGGLETPRRPALGNCGIGAGGWGGTRLARCRAGVPRRTTRESSRVGPVRSKCQCTESCPAGRRVPPLGIQGFRTGASTRSGRARARLAGWVAASVDLRLGIDGKALALDPSEAVLYAPRPAVCGEAPRWEAADPIPAEPRRARMFVGRDRATDRPPGARQDGVGRATGPDENGNANFKAP